ncbi:MAG TPA: F0F1 ATP synthase subunit epsilon [Candidatus Saccharibacteria bacterium]|nr:F0F1 ATP synthase subunit epsilon [Candidatus Saccharibacteria bacterium]HRK93776.1 F0F1 ATP synthase subunit epsilon [Candidatus Saccharibacteria bacterium]
MPKSDLTERLNVVARSPFELYFEGEATALSATNRIGDFDILPGHADFFSMLEPGEIIVTPTEGEPVKIDTKSGIITVRDNQVLLFVNM